MNDWQMAQQILNPITPLARRVPMNLTTGRKKPQEDFYPAVTPDEIRMFKTLSESGWSSHEIADATNRHERTVRRHLAGLSK